MNRRLSSLAVVFLYMTLAASAQQDTIRVPEKKLNTHYLKPGMNQYLITMQDLKNKKSLFLWYWLRDIKIETHNGADVFSITQHWYGSDTLNYRTVYSLNRKSDFSPLYHSETARGRINAYNWGPAKITGADSVANNSKKDFAFDFQSPNLNWNLDIETFEMLPLGPGKVFAINFYDAGLDPPAYIIYKVTGSETIDYGGQKVDCWKLYTEGSHKNTRYKETFWLSKKDHEFLREEDEYGEGLFRTKVKMPVNIDLLTRFER